MMQLIRAKKITMFCFFLLFYCFSCKSTTKEKCGKAELSEVVFNEVKKIPKGKIIVDEELKKRYNVSIDSLTLIPLKNSNNSIQVYLREYTFDTLINKTHCFFIFKSVFFDKKPINKRLLFHFNDFLSTMVENTNSVSKSNLLYITIIEDISKKDDNNLLFDYFFYSSVGGAGSFGLKIKYELPIQDYINYSEDIDVKAWKKIEKFQISEKLL